MEERNKDSLDAYKGTNDLFQMLLYFTQICAELLIS